MKHTNQALMTNGTFSTAGYNLVYTGKFPNLPGSGWMEVMLDSAFQYDGINNLQVLVVKGYQPAIANTPVTPRWYYTDSNTRARRYYGNVAISAATSCTTTTYLSNARLGFQATGVVDIAPGFVTVYPNPSNGEVSIRSNHPADLHLDIVDVSGRLIYVSNLGSNEQAVISGLQAGSYIYYLRNESGQLFTSGRFIVR